MENSKQKQDVYTASHMINSEKFGFGESRNEIFPVQKSIRHATEGKIREAVAIFDRQEDLESAVSELEVTAFPRHDISVLGGKDDVRRRFFTDYVEPEKVEDNPLTPRVAPVMPEEKTIGAGAICSVFAYVTGCATAIFADVTSEMSLIVFITIGSFIGAALGFAIVLGLRSFLKKDIRRQIEKGGLVLWVRTPSPDYEDMACAILNKHNGRHIHIHAIQ